MENNFSMINSNKQCHHIFLADIFLLFLFTTCAIEETRHLLSLYVRPLACLANR